MLKAELTAETLKSREKKIKILPTKSLTASQKALGYGISLAFLW